MAGHVINSGCSITASKDSSVSLNESKDIDNKKSYFRAVKEYLTAKKLLIALASPFAVILLSTAGGALGAVALPIVAAYAEGVILGPAAVVIAPPLIIVGVLIGGLTFVTLTGLGIYKAVTDWFSSVEYAQTQGEKKLTAKLDKFKKLESSYKSKINLLNDEIKTFLNNKDKEIKKTDGAYSDFKVIKINTQVEKNRAKIKKLSHDVKDNEKEIEFINTALSKLAEQKNNDKNHATEDILDAPTVV